MPEHRVDGVSRAVQRAEYVGLDQRPRLAGIERVDPGDVVGPGVVDQTVDLAKGGNARLDQPAGVLPLGHIGDAGDGFAAFRDNRRRYVVRFGSVDVVHDHRGTSTGSALGACGADPPAGSCDDDGLAAQQVHLVLLIASRLRDAREGCV